MFESLYILPFVGVFVGFISGFFGIGGGAILVPVLLAFGYDIKSAIADATMLMLTAAIFGSYFNYKRAKYELRGAIILGLGAAFGSLFSGFIVEAVPELALKITLACAIVFNFYRLLRINIHENTGDVNIPEIWLFIIGAVIAAFAISIGMGGAVFLTPLLVGVLGVDITKAISLGLFFVIFSSFGGFVSMSYNGLIDYKIGAILSVGGLVGVYFGTLAHHKIEKHKQKLALMGLNIITFSLVMRSIFLS